jgi:hypothetical protein
MSTVRSWTITAIGVAGAAAGLALLRRPRRAPAALAPPPLPAAAPGPPEDPAAALDAARARLRRRADELRAQIESADRAPAPPG